MGSSGEGLSDVDQVILDGAIIGGGQAEATDDGGLLVIGGLGLLVLVL